MASEESKPSAKQEKTDISKLLALIPSAAELRSEKKKPTEKRIKIKFNKAFTKPIARIPIHIATELDIKPGDQVEIVVAGRRKAILEAELYETKENIVEVYPEELEKQGVADNSVATIRKLKAST